VETGKQVLSAMMEQDRTALCGSADRHDAERRAVRAGGTPSAVVLGGRRIGMGRPRVRSVADGDFQLPSFEAAARQDPLDRHTLEAIASGVTMRRYARSLEPLPASEADRSTSRSSVSRRFVALTQRRLAETCSRPLGDLDLRVVMVDGIAFSDHCVLLPLGVATDGSRHVLGLWEGSTEHSSVAKAPLRDLIERGLPTDRALLFVIDGSKALRQAWAASQAELARRQLERLAASLEGAHPGAAASLREGPEETLTLLALGIDGALYRTLRSTNPIENRNGSVADYTKNVKRWRGGGMILRWVGAAVVEASKRFHKVRGHRDLRQLVLALQKHEQKLGVRTEKEAA